MEFWNGNPSEYRRIFSSGWNTKRPAWRETLFGESFLAFGFVAGHNVNVGPEVGAVG
jgi:hypothetical protein